MESVLRFQKPFAILFGLVMMAISVLYKESALVSTFDLKKRDEDLAFAPAAAEKLMPTHVRQLLSQTSDDSLYPWKQLNLTTALNFTDAAPNKIGAMIHVGKCGGSTVCQQLRNGCHSWMPKPCIGTGIPRNESYISKLTTYYHTPDFDLLYKRKHQFYVSTMRDPYSRFVSAFTFMHPANVRARGDRMWGPAKLYPDFYEPCFPTIDDFASYLMPRNGTTSYAEDDANLNYSYPFDAKVTNSSSCRDLARASMHNKVRSPEHLYYNIRFLYERLIDNWREPSVALLLIRQEALWEDWQSANQWLGQGPVAIFPKVRVRVTSDLKVELPVSSKHTDESRAAICRALSSEYETYLHLLIKAANLTPEEKQRSLEISRSNCPNLDLQWPTTSFLAVDE